jgi:acyl-coenzyme A synthetase/AMP-(fatty) acid ligase
MVHAARHDAPFLPIPGTEIDVLTMAQGGPIIAGIAATASRDPERPAFIDRSGPITYAALAADHAALAGWLLRQGIERGMTVGITVREDPRHILLALALMRLGCSQVTLPSHDPPAQRAAIAARLGLVLVIGDEAADALPGIPFLALPSGRPEGEAPPPADDGDTPAIFTSSGTTGLAKLIPIPERDLARQFARRRGQARVFFRSTSVEFNNAKKGHLGSLAHGMTTVLAACAALPDLAEACARFGIDRVSLPTERAAALATIQARPGAHPWPSRTRLYVFGSEVPATLRRTLREVVTPHVLVHYSTTETGLIAEAGPEDHDRHPDSVGRPLPDVALRIVDEAGRDLPPQEFGLLRLRVPGMACRYLHDEAATARAFRDGWFQPGDRVRLDPDGTLIFAGRNDEMMILGTINIFPAEIEHAVAGFPGLAECAAFPLRSPVFGDIPALAAVEAAPGALDTAALLAAARARLGHRAPRRVFLVPALPRNANGKVLRNRLAQIVAAGRTEPEDPSAQA